MKAPAMNSNNPRCTAYQEAGPSVRARGQQASLMGGASFAVGGPMKSQLPTDGQLPRDGRNQVKAGGRC